MKPHLFIICSGLFVMVFGIPAVVFGQLSQPAVSENSGCTKPVAWHIGEVDQRFNIDKETLQTVMEEVAALWSDAAGARMIAYSDSGEVTINFIYGKAQTYTDSERAISKRIDKTRLQHFALEQEYEHLFYDHQEKSKTYNKMRHTFFEKVDDYNWMVSRRSDTRVVEKSENDRLAKLKKDIQRLEGKLNEQKEQLNAMIKKLDRLSARLDDVANRVNRMIFSYRDRFGSTQTFYQGVYIDDLNHRKINIYEFENSDKLRLVLAHEVGHALGLGHVDNPESIMYYKLEKQDEKNLQLTGEDARAIRQRCAAAGNRR